MRKALLIIVLSLTGLVLLAAVALGVFFTMFDPNDYKEDLRAAAQKATGRNLVFHGDLEVAFFPVPGLKTGKLTLLDPEQFGPEPFLEVESASFSVATQPLRQGILRFEDVHINGARFKAATSATGENNWEYGFSKGKKADAAPDTAEQAGESAVTALAPPVEETAAAVEKKKKSRFTVEVRALQFGKSDFIYRDMRNNTAWSGSISAFALDNPAAGAPLPLDLSGQVRDNNSARKFEFALKSVIEQQDDNSIAAKIDAVSLSGEAAETRFSVSGHGVVGYNPQERTVRISAWQGVLSLFYMEEEKEKEQRSSYETALELNLPGGGQKMSLSGNLTVDALNIDVLQKRLAPVAGPQGASVQGAPNLPRPTVVKGTQAGRHNLPAIAAPEKEKEQQAAAGLSGAFEGRLDIEVRDLTAGGLPLRNVKASPEIAGGRVTIPYSLGIFDGTVKGQASLTESSGKAPLFALALQADGIQLEQATKRASDKYTVTGVLSGNMKVEGTGNNSGEIMHSLRGTASAAASGGEVRGFRLIPSDLQGLGKVVPETFPYTRISASANIADGAATSKDIALASPTLTGRGGGTIHLSHKQVDLGIDFLLGGLPPAVPVHISGPFSSLSYSVDTRRFLRNVTESALQEPKAVENLLNSPEARRNLLRGIGGTLIRR